MITDLEFDREFFKCACYRIRPPVTEEDWKQFESAARHQKIFADLKIPASDLDTAKAAFARSFRKICSQVTLCHAARQAQLTKDVLFLDRLELGREVYRAHAERFRSSRFRQDSLIPAATSNTLYAAWIANSLNGQKRVAAIGGDFCSFADRDSRRYVDLLSVIDKGRGHALAIMNAVVADAYASSIREIWVTTEIENEPAIRVYTKAGFQIRSFSNVFHFGPRALSDVENRRADRSD